MLPLLLLLRLCRHLETGMPFAIRHILCTFLGILFTHAVLIGWLAAKLCFDVVEIGKRTSQYLAFQIPNHGQNMHWYLHILVVKGMAIL